MGIGRFRLRMVVACLSFAAVGLGVSVFGDEKPAAKSKKVKSKVVPAKTLAPLFKSKSEPLWDKGLARLTAESLENDEVFELVVTFLEREAKDVRYSPALVRAIALFAETDRPKTTEILTLLLQSGDYRIVMAA